MGAIFSLFAAIGELSALTGFTAEAILTGEAAAALTAELSALITLEGLTQAEALSALGLSVESLALASSVAQAAEVGSNILAGVFVGSVPIATAALGGPFSPTGMALQVYRPEIWIFPESQWFYNAYHYFDPNSWLPTLFEQMSNSFWSALEQYGRRRFQTEGTALAIRTTNRVWSSIAEVINNAVWYVRNGYYNLENYYRMLPPRLAGPRLSSYLEAHRYGDWNVDPPEFLDNARSQNQESSWSNWFENTAEKFRKIKKAWDEEPESGIKVEKVIPPGGANQEITPDWLLPLILGLLGDLTPTFAADIKSYGTQKGIKRKRKTSTNSSSETTRKRRNRGFKRSYRP